MNAYEQYLHDTMSEDWMFCNECSKIYTVVGIGQTLKEGIPFRFHNQDCPKDVPSCNVLKHFEDVFRRKMAVISARKDKFLDKVISLEEKFTLAHYYFPMQVPNNIIGMRTFERWDNYREMLLEKYNWKKHFAEIRYPTEITYKPKRAKDHNNKNFYKKFKR